MQTQATIDKSGNTQKWGILVSEHPLDIKLIFHMICHINTNIKNHSSLWDSKKNPEDGMIPKQHHITRKNDTWERKKKDTFFQVLPNSIIKWGNITSYCIIMIKRHYICLEWGPILLQLGWNEESNELEKKILHRIEFFNCMAQNDWLMWYLLFLKFYWELSSLFLKVLWLTNELINKYTIK